MVVKNDLLEGIALELEASFRRYEPGWGRVVERFKTTEAFRKMNYSFSGLVTHLTREDLHTRLEGICAPLGDRIAANPIQNGESKGGFLFERQDDKPIEEFPFGRQEGGVEVRTASGEGYTKLDYVLLIDCLPVLFDIKLGAYRKRSGKSARGSRGIVISLREERVDYVLKPLEQYFGSPCGYVLVIYPEFIKPCSPLQKGYSPVQQGFRERNGILVPYYADRETVKTDVTEVALDHGLVTGKV